MELRRKADLVIFLRSSRHLILELGILNSVDLKGSNFEDLDLHPGFGFLSPSSKNSILFKQHDR